MSDPRRPSWRRRLGILSLLGSAALFAKVAFLAWQDVIVRLADFGWFWLPLRLLSRLDSPWRMYLAWTREPQYAGELLAVATVGLRIVLAHLPILIVVAMVVGLATRRQADFAAWLGRAVALFLLPDAVLLGLGTAAALGLGGWARRLVSLLIACLLALCLRLFVAWSAAGLTREKWPAATGLAVAALAVAMPAVGTVGAGRAPQLPNILLVSVDSLRADHLGSYGYPRPTSPTIDRLAGQGARFSVVLAPSSWTLPSHITLLTGLPPRVHGVVDSDRRLGVRVETLAQRLASHGYHGLALVSGRYLDASYGYPRGFESYDDFTLKLLLQRLGAQRRVTAGAIDDLVERRLRSWAERHSGRRPFFLFLHLFDVHYDYIPPPPFDGLFVEGAVAGFDLSDFAHNEAIHEGMPKESLAYIISQYDGEIRATDELIGSVVSTLEELGVLDQTIVAITADHGEEFFEHGNKGHRVTLYEESVRVPLVVRYPPRIPAGIVLSEPVALQDVGPTLLGLAGIRESFGLAEAGAAWAARDLSSRLTRRLEIPPVDRSSYVFGSLRERTYYVRSERFKLILDLRSDPAVEELYRLDLDPGETTNVLADYEEEAEELRQLLGGYMSLQGGVGSDNRRELSDEMKRDLEALGYLD